MPHLVVEYSEGALARDGVTGLMEALFEAACRTGIMKAEDVKVRACVYNDFLVAGRRDSFVHLSVYLLEGRSPDQKVELSTSLRRTMTERCPDVVSISVDVRDMDPVAYKKRLK